MELQLPIFSEPYIIRKKYTPKYDASGNFELSDLLNEFQYLAGDQLEELDLGDSYREEQSFYYVVVRMKSYFFDVLDEHKTYTLTTFPLQATTLQLYRYAYLTDENGKIVFALVSLWVLLDKNTRRLKITKNFQNKIRDKLPSIDEVKPLIEERLVQIDTEQLEFEDVAEYRITSDDIDRNGHMNNTKYVKICEPLLNGMRYSSMEIDFEKECFQDETLHLSVSNALESVYIKGKKDNGELSFVIKYNR